MMAEFAGASACGRAAEGCLLLAGERVGSPGLGMRICFTAMRRPACSYISVTAASAWLTVAGLDRAVSMSRVHAVTAPSALDQVRERVAGGAGIRGQPADVRGGLPLLRGRTK
jgi:hypothetical protein